MNIFTYFNRFTYQNTRYEYKSRCWHSELAVGDRRIMYLCRHYTVTFLFYGGALGHTSWVSQPCRNLAQQAPLCAAPYLLFSHITEKHSAEEGIIRYLCFIMPSQIVSSIYGVDNPHLELTALSKSDRETD